MSTLRDFAISRATLPILVELRHFPQWHGACIDFPKSNLRKCLMLSVSNDISWGSSYTTHFQIAPWSSYKHMCWDAWLIFHGSKFSPRVEIDQWTKNVFPTSGRLDGPRVTGWKTQKNPKKRVILWNATGIFTHFLLFFMVFKVFSSFLSLFDAISRLSCVI